MSPGDIGVTKRVLQARLEGLDAEAKYFLARTLWLHGMNPVESNLDELERDYGMSRSKIIKARNALFQARGGEGLLVERTVQGRHGPAVGRFLKGRTRRGFVVWPELYKWLADQEGLEHGGVQRKGVLVGSSSLSCSDLNDRVITQLILERGDSAGSPRVIMQDGKREPPDRAGLAGRLSIQNRVFLALLWGLADRFGIVRNTGLSGLGEMAGNMTRDQVCSQLAKLERLGYVKSRVGGISASRIFGRSEGAILLNSIHPALYQPDGAREMQWMDFRGLGEGALVRVWEAFDQADKIQRRIESIEATRDRLKSGEGVIPESQRWKIDTLILDLRQEIRAFEHENQLPSSEHDLTHLVGSSVDSNIMPGLVTYTFELFSGTSLSARRFTLLVVCLYANELLHRNPGKHLSGGMVDYEMLDDISNALSDRVFGINPNLRRCIAGWIYDLARDLAGDVLSWRSRALGYGEDQILTKCAYTLFPSKDSKSILTMTVFLDEPTKSWIKGW